MSDYQPKGHYNQGTIKEIPDDEFTEQWKLFDAEKARRDALANAGRELDQFLINYRKTLGSNEYKPGMEWFEPSDVFDAYAKGFIVKGDDDHYYKSLQHANEAPLDYRQYWQDLGTEIPAELKPPTPRKPETESE